MLLLVTVVGCRSTGLRLTAEQEQIRKELAVISPRDDSLARDSPIVDIHTHTFNARYLPLRNILLGKRDAATPYTWLISDSCAATLAHSLIARTELAPAPGGEGVPRMDSASQAQEHRDKREESGEPPHQEQDDQSTEDCHDEEDRQQPELLPHPQEGPEFTQKAGHLTLRTGS